MPRSVQTALTASAIPLTAGAVTSAAIKFTSTSKAPDAVSVNFAGKKGGRALYYGHEWGTV